MKATNTGLFLLGHFLAGFILAIILERVDNKEMGRWPFPPGLAVGMTTAVFPCSGSFSSVQNSLNKLRILFLKERGDSA